MALPVMESVTDVTPPKLSMYIFSVVPPTEKDFNVVVLRIVVAPVTANVPPMVALLSIFALVDICAAPVTVRTLSGAKPPKIALPLLLTNLKLALFEAMSLYT